MNGFIRTLLTALAIAAGVVAFAGEPLPCASAESMDRLLAAWTAAFAAAHPETPARVVRRARYAADLVEPLAQGVVRVATFPRELFPAERARIRAVTGAEPWVVPVATGSRATKGGTHAIVLYVNQGNPLTRISLNQLREILAEDGKIRTWGQLGLTGQWAGRRINLHGMRVRRESGNPPGIVNYLADRVLHGRPWRPDIHEQADVPGGPQALAQIVQAVAADPDGLGYSGFAYAAPGAKALAVGETEVGPFWDGSREEIALHRYPLTRLVYLVTQPHPDATVQAFVRFVLSPEGQRAVAADPGGFFALPVLPAGNVRYLTPDGAVSVVGYNDMAEMIAAWGDRFVQHYPGVRFSLRLQGTRSALPALEQGRSAFGPMGAEPNPAEVTEFRAATGSELQWFRIAHASLSPRALSGPLAVVVPASSPRRTVTLDELHDLLAGRVQDGVRVYAMAPETALGRYTRDRLLAGGPYAPGVRTFGQSRDVVRALAADPTGIGLAAAVAITADVRALAVAPGAAEVPVALTPENIRAGRYPLDRFLLISARIPLDPLVRAYLDLVLSPQGQEVINQGSLGYLPLNDAERAAERTRLQAW
ncbi:MAG: substrate-binding domain-containing protein [Verrucomicrobia bacterium]|nr:substrate-binding domain-containing protein [Verrucomicrobiota bacterium]